MEPINAVMHQGAGWHSRADPRDHYGADDISAKPTMSPLEAADIPPEGGPKYTKGENLQNHAHSVYVKRLVLNTTVMTLIVSDYKEFMKPEPCFMTAKTAFSRMLYKISGIKMQNCCQL